MSEHMGVEESIGGDGTRRRNEEFAALAAERNALRAALDKAKAALMKIRDGIDGEYIATQRGVAIAANALAELEGKNA